MIDINEYNKFITQSIIFTKWNTKSITNKILLFRLISRHDVIVYLIFKKKM